MSQEHKCASQICSPPTVKVCLCIPVRWNVQRVVSSQHSCIIGCWKTKKIRIRKMFNKVGFILQQKQIDFVFGVQFSVYNWKMFWQQFNSCPSPLKQTMQLPSNLESIYFAAIIVWQRDACLVYQVNEQKLTLSRDQEMILLGLTK